MNLRYTGRFVVAGVAIASALTITACSDDSGNSTSTTTTTTAATTSAAPAIVSAAVLNQEWQSVMDPSVPFSQKVTYLQGMQADPNLPAKLQQLATQNKVKFDITSVTPTGGDTATATATMTLNGKPVDPSQTPPVQLVYEDGKWKVAKSFVCQILTFGNIKSPACPAS